MAYQRTPEEDADLQQTQSEVEQEMQAQEPGFKDAQTLERLAPAKYEMRPELADYLSRAKAGVNQAALDERQQNNTWDTFDKLGDIRANAYGLKNVHIANPSDAAQTEAAGINKMVSGAELGDIQGHQKNREELALALARKRGENNSLKGTGMVTSGGVNVFATGVDDNGNPILKTPGGKRVLDTDVMPGTVYANLKRNEIVTPAQTEALTGYDSIIAELEKAKKAKENIDTGPVASIQNKLAYELGIDDPKVSQFRATVGELVADFLKSKTGATASNQERDFLMANQPNMKDNDETFNAKIDRSLAKIKELKDRSLKNMTNAGKDMSKFNIISPEQANSASTQNPTTQTSIYPKTVTNGSKKAVVQNAQEEAEANSEGFK